MRGAGVRGGRLSGGSCPGGLCPGASLKPTVQFSYIRTVFYFYCLFFLALTVFVLIYDYFLCPVALPPRSNCYTGAAVSLPSDTLYISNTVTERTKCGSKQSPWKLEALPGQQINLTLLDFTEHPSVPVVSERCAVRYALVKEQGMRENSMCRETKGNYLSTSSSLKLSVLPGGTHRRFFIKYQGECTTCTICQYYLSTSSSLNLSLLPGGTHRRFFIKYQGK